MPDEFKGISMDMMIFDECKDDTEDDLTIAYQLGYYDCKKDLMRRLEPILKEFKDCREWHDVNPDSLVVIEPFYIERLLDILE